MAIQGQVIHWGDLIALRAQGDDPDSWTLVIMSSDLARKILPPPMDYWTHCIALG